MKNLLIVTPWYLPQRGGVATAVTSLSQALAARGNVSVLLKKRGTRLKIENVESPRQRLHLYSFLLRAPVDPEKPLRRLTAFLWQAPGTLRRLLRFVREHNFDAINLHYPSSSDIYFVWIRRVTGIPLLVTVHGSDLGRLNSRPLVHRFVVRAVLRAADRIVLASDAFLRQSLLPVYPRAVDKTALIPMAIDWRDFEALEAKPAVNAPERFILCVAKLVPLKGVDVLLRAFKELASTCPKDHLMIVGDGPARTELLELTRNLGLDRSVTFTGGLPREQVLALMKKCLFFVLPSYFESFGLVNLEAHACRKAVVSSRTGGIPEVVEHEVSGLLAQPGDVADLREQMRRLLLDPTLRQRLGDAGFSAIRSRGLTWEACADKYLRLLEEPPRETNVGAKPAAAG